MAEDAPERQVGVEIEFAGLDAHQAARAVAEALDGEVTLEGPHMARVTGTPLGALEFELDTRYAKPPDRRRGLIDRALESIGARGEAADLLSYIVPVELVTGPLAPDRFPLLDRAVAALREAGAEGTDSAPLYAFGMHLNIALGHGGAERAIRIAAAYTFAERWLRERFPTDRSRRLTPFIDPYPKGFRADLGAAMAGGALPGLEEFIRLYRVYNPTRNRGLDLWPLLGHLASEVAERAHGSPIKNARPAFHYRWPDSRIADPEWSPWDELERWDSFERVADDPLMLETLREASTALESGQGAHSRYMRTADGIFG